MSSLNRNLTVVVLLILAAFAPAGAQAEPASARTLANEWWQWALSIPTPVNPLTDTTGEDCVVGQSGETWFLAGTFSGGTAVRTCTVPETVDLFFPVANAIGFDSPNICGQGPDSVTVAELRAALAGLIDGMENLEVELDGVSLTNFRRLRSPVFDISMPEDNLFDAPCAGLGGHPAGNFSPAVHDGFYMLVKNLSLGAHTLRFAAENPAIGFDLDVTYHLNVVAVKP
jgi:hypothetical protein